MRLVTTATAKIHANNQMFADQMLSANSKITAQLVNVQPVLKEIQHPNKDVFVFQLHVYQPTNAPAVTCALPINVMYRVLIQKHVPLGKDAPTANALRSVTPTITACPAKFVTKAEHAKQVAPPMPIARLPKYVLMVNASAAEVLLEHRSAALTSMNVPKIHAMQVPVVIIFPDRSVAHVQNKLSEIRTEHLDVPHPTNVVAVVTALKTLNATKESVPIRVSRKNVDATLFVNQLIMELFAFAQLAILVILPINLSDASVWSV